MTTIIVLAIFAILMYKISERNFRKTVTEVWTSKIGKSVQHATIQGCEGTVIGFHIPTNVLNVEWKNGEIAYYPVSALVFRD